MFDSLTNTEKKAIAHIGLGILGIKTGGRIRTNEPAIYNLFVDVFDVCSQEEILPILQELMTIDQDSATRICASLSYSEKDEFRRYLIAAAEGDNRTLLATAFFMKNIGFTM